MMTCDTFRAQFAPATEDPALLEHLRSCDACLNFAVEQDGDVLFRSIGGDNSIPPGGVDAFVDDVMRAVRIRGTEHIAAGRVVAWPRKLAVAATIAAAITGGALIFEHRKPMPVLATARPTAVVHRAVASAKPIIENYDSQQATIVEVPTEGEDIKVVMVFDDSLPADL